MLPMFFKKLYVAFVRPHLEYAQSTWSPYLRKHINAIENLQMPATKYLDGFNQLSFTERLQRLNQPTLAHRRKHGDMIEVFKHSTTYDKAAFSTAMKFSNRSSRTDDRKILRLEATDGVRVPATWNDLPRYVVELKSMTLFKERLDAHWRNDEGRLVFDSVPYHYARYDE